MNQNVSLFSAPITAPNHLKPAKNPTLAEVNEYLHSAQAKELTEAYRRLPIQKQKEFKTQRFDAVTFSGTFSRRAGADRLTDSGMIVLDFDHTASQGWDPEELKRDIATDPRLPVRLAFVSPSGDGLKVVLDRPVGIPHKDSFDTLKNYFEEWYGIGPDPSGSDIARACFLPYDPDSYYNSSPEHLAPAELEKWRREFAGSADSGTRRATKSPQDKTGLAGAFCRAYTIQGAIEAFLPGTYTPTRNPRRYTFAGGSSFGGLCITRDGTRAYSHHATDPAGGRALSAFDLVRIHKFGNDDGSPASESFRRMAALAAADPKIREGAAAADFEDIPGSEAAPAGQKELLESLHPFDARKAAESLGLEPDKVMTLKAHLVATMNELRSQLDALGSGLGFLNGSPFVYMDGHWKEQTREEMQNFLTSGAIRLGVRPIQALHYETQDDLWKQASAVARLIPPQREPERVSINFRTQTGDFENGRLNLRPQSRSDYLTYRLPYDYDPAAKCPAWQKTLDRVLPDKAAQDVLAEFVGNVFAPALNMQKALVLYGDGNNGKSVVCSVITALLGRENVCCYTAESLTARDDYRACLANKLLNYSGENSIKLNAEIFKALVRCEPTPARPLFGKPFIMENYARLMFNCNQLPVSVEQTEGFFRSFLILPFDVKITEAEKDPHLAEKIIAEELPGVFNWMIAGLQRLLRNGGYTDCESSRSALDRYRTESNSVLCFLDDCQVMPAPAEKGPLQTLFRAYKSYCLDYGHRYPVSLRTFSASLKKQGFQVKRESSGNMVFYAASRLTLDY